MLEFMRQRMAKALTPSPALLAGMVILALTVALGGVAIGVLADRSPDYPDYYVATTGSDSNAGSRTAPWHTIARAASVVSPGSTVHVKPGTYAESTINVSRSGRPGAPIKFVSDSRHEAVVAGSSWHAFNITGSHVTIQGFEVLMTTP